MRKYNEGYTLPFVLVVFLVTSLVAVSILTVSIHNLHGQKASIHRMEAQYAAQGAMEAVVAQLRNKMELTGFQLNGDNTSTDAESVISARIDAFCGGIYDENSTNAIFRGESLYTANDGNTNEFTYSFDLVSTCGSVMVTSRISLTGVYSNSSFEGTVLHTIHDPDVTIESYTITTAEPTTEESAGGPQ